MTSSTICLIVELLNIVVVPEYLAASCVSSLGFVRSRADGIFRDGFLVFRKPILIERAHRVLVSWFFVRAMVTLYAFIFHTSDLQTAEEKGTCLLGNH
jgi:hypothetical protein